MNVAIVFGITLALLFALAYFTKRRFGVLGLALAAGSILSDLWATELTPIIANTGFTIVAPPLLTLVSVALVLLPAVALLTSGPTYHARPERIGGAFLFAALAVALLIEPFGSALVLSGDSATVYDWFSENRVWIITFGLIAALVDLLFTKTPKHDKAKH